MVNFEEGTLIKAAYAVVNGEEVPVHMPEYSGNTPISPENLNKLQEDLKKEDANWTDKLKGTVIYKNETGISAGSFDLEDDITNYKKLDFYDINGNFVGKCLTSADTVYLSYLNQGSGTLYMVSARLTRSGSTFTFYSNYRNMFSGSEWTTDTGYQITIGTIIGYKEV